MDIGCEKKAYKKRGKALTPHEKEAYKKRAKALTPRTRADGQLQRLQIGGEAFRQLAERATKASAHSEGQLAIEQPQLHLKGEGGGDP